MYVYPFPKVHKHGHIRTMVKPLYNGHHSGQQGVYSRHFISNKKHIIHILLFNSSKAVQNFQKWL